MTPDPRDPQDPRDPRDPGDPGHKRIVPGGWILLIYAANRHFFNLKMTKTVKVDTCLPGIVVFAGKKPPEATRFGSSYGSPPGIVVFAGKKPPEATRFGSPYGSPPPGPH